MHPLSFILICLCCLFQPGCASYRIPTSEFRHPLSTIEIECSEEGIFTYNRECAANHWLYTFIPRHRCQIKWYDLGHWLTWMALGNDDEGIFGEGKTAHFKLYEPVSFQKAISWNLRNPLHNFTHYVIGSADRQNSELTLIQLSQEECLFFHYLPQGKTEFAGKGSSFYLGFHGWKPFISCRLCYSQNWQGEWYVGWRSRGNFGIKVLPLRHRK